MRKISGIFVILLWAGLFCGLAAQLYHTYSVNRLNTRIMKLYTIKSNVPKEFQAATDSLRKEIIKLIDKRDSYQNRVPLKPVFGSTYFLQMYLFSIAIVTFFWLYYNKHKPE